MSKGFSTACLHGYEDFTSNKAHVLPIFASSSFMFDDLDHGISIFTKKEPGHVYSRYNNPTIQTVADKIAQLESLGTGIESTAFLTSSGMSAIYIVMQSLLKPGDILLAQKKLYGGTTELFQKSLAPNGIQILSMDLSDTNEIEQSLKSNPGIKAIYLETPSNPTLDIVDIRAIAEIAQKYNVQTVVDNTFPTPYLQQPFLYGVDHIIHSTTKYLNGHGNSIAGAIVSKHTDWMQTTVWTQLKLIGATCNPFDAWLLYNGLKTLALRMDRHCTNAMAVADLLESHPEVAVVYYPGLKSNRGYDIATKQMTRGYGGMLSFELKGDLPAVKSFLKSIQLATQAPTLGDVDTLIMHPATSSHLNIVKEERIKEGVTDGLLRMSIGIEDTEDLLNDIQQALDKIRVIISGSDS